jgi:hypothetical protein
LIDFFVGFIFGHNNKVNDKISKLLYRCTPN